VEGRGGEGLLGRHQLLDAGNRVGIDGTKTRTTGGRTLFSNGTAPLKPKSGLKGPPSRRMKGVADGRELTAALAAPAADFLQTCAAGVLEQAYLMAGMLEFVDVRPNFRLPALFVDGGFSTSGAARVQSSSNRLGG
jgi:hypothetical protein